MDQIKKTTINPIINKDNKCLQYAVTVALNHEKIKKQPKMMRKIKPFINKYNWEEINFLSEKLKKITLQLLLTFCMLKKEKYILPMFQNIAQIVKNKLFF